jgi:ectoine hydroxylase-related dioxygenase (phytanoyl-CoA dioxygenase family)
MPIERLSADTTGERVAEVLARDGCVVVENLVPRATMDRARAELEPYVQQTAFGNDPFSGRRTRRTPTCRELVMHPLALAATKASLVDATSFHLHLTQIIAIGPGEPGQTIHRDQWAFDFFPFPKGYEVQCNTIWAMTDFTAENGGTRVIPGSNHFEDRRQFTHDECEAVEMSAGSVVFYNGSIYHGGGANRSNETRYGVNITYARSWLRQEENQYLAVPHDVARTFPEPLLRLMGYARGAYALGYVDDLRDPLQVLLGRKVADDGLGDLRAANERALTPLE